MIKIKIDKNKLNEPVFKLWFKELNEKEERFLKRALIESKEIQGSYKYDVKEDIKHPLFEPKKDPYEELFTDTSTLASKGISGAENLTAMNLQGER